MIQNLRLNREQELKTKRGMEMIKEYVMKGKKVEGLQWDGYNLALMQAFLGSGFYVWMDCYNQLVILDTKLRGRLFVAQSEHVMCSGDDVYLVDEFTLNLVYERV